MTDIKEGKKQKGGLNKKPTSKRPPPPKGQKGKVPPVKKVKKSAGEKKGRGRPTKFDAETANKIVTAIRGGNYMETAASFAGISKETLHDWLRKGGRGEKPYDEFSDSVKKALAEAEAMDVALVGKAAAAGAWQAAAWRLERRNRKNWGRRDRVDIGKINPDELSDEDLDAIIAGTADRSGEDGP